MTRGMPARVRLALLMAMAVESNFRHLNYGHSSSMGVLQQRPDMGWGPYIAGPRGVRQDVRDFLRRASPANRGLRGSAGELAQAVQRSAFPARYDQRRAQATALLRRFDRGGAAASGPGMAARRPPQTRSAVQAISLPPYKPFVMPAPGQVLAGLTP